MTSLERLDKAAYAFASRIAALGVLGILGIGVATVVDVLLRFAFNAPIPGLNEITAPLLALGVAACLPAGFAGRVNIALEFADRLVGPTVLAWLRVFAAAMLLLFISLVSWRLVAIGLKFAERGQVSAILSLPVGQFMVAVGGIVGLAIPVQLIKLFGDGADAFARNRTAGLLVLAAVALVVVVALLFGDAMPLTWLFGMDAVSLAAVCFGLMWVAIFLKVPIGAAMGLTGLLGSAVILGTAPGLNMFGTKIHEMIFSDSLAVLPLFLLMGSFATVAGMSADIYRLAQSCIGHLRGGLLYATILGSAGFGALTGSSLATSATIGKAALPEMAKRKYSRSLAAGTVAAGGTLGQLIPPSTVIVVYALLTEESIGTLFIATIVPALLAVALYMTAVFLTVRFGKGDTPAGEPGSGREILRNLGRSWQVMLLIGAVIGGLYTGVFTETEAASVGAVGTFLFAVLRGTVNRTSVWDVMRETTETIAMIYVLIFGAVNFSFLVGISGLPNLFVGMMTEITSEPLLIIAILAIIYLILGTVMDTFAIMIITVPVFLPLVVQFGYDPIWWGIVTVCLVETGMITPPFGLNLFVLKAIDKDVTLAQIYRGVAPFIFADVVKIALLILFPAIILWLPYSR